MKVSRPTLDLSIITYNNQDVLTEYRGSPALYPVHKSICKLFLDSYNFDKNGRVLFSLNDQGQNHPDIKNIEDFKHLAHKCYPDFDFASDCYDDVCKKLSENGDLQWKYDKICWIGSAQSLVRKDFMKIKHDRIYSLDLLNLNNTHLSEDDVKKMNIREEQQKYRYLIDIPSGYEQEAGGSRRIKYMLHSKRLIFLVDRQIHDWVSSKLEPFVHYIPVKEDFSDLFEKIEWADTHPKEVEQIIKNATSIAPFRRDAINHLHQIIPHNM